MSRVLKGAVAATLILAACGGSAGHSTAITKAPQPAETTTTATTTLPGRLAVIDAAGEVATLQPDGSSLQLLTSDAGSVTHFQAVWSPNDGRLAWGETSASGSALVIRDEQSIETVSFPTPPFFSMWSPDGSRIGSLHGAAGGLQLKVIDTETGAASTAMAGAPLYFSWGPDGSRFVSHVGGTGLFLVGGETVTVVTETVGDFQTPVWADSGVFYVEGGELVVDDLAAGARSLARLAGPASFVADPQGSRLAVQVINPDAPAVFASLSAIPDVPSNAVVVLDPETGSMDVVWREVSAGFFWSPDGRSLLIAARGGAGSREMRWAVWRDGEIVLQTEFVPPDTLVRDVLPFFDQYAQAWQPWSPDSEAFAFAGAVGGQDGVWVQRLDGTGAEWVTDGDWVAWSSG